MLQAKLAVVAEKERRGKVRFPFEREIRYKLLKDNAVVESGVGRTVNMSSNGIAFSTERSLESGHYIELAVSWPVLLENSTPMRLIVFGRVVRSGSRTTVCTIEKYEYRTQARGLHALPAIRTDSKLQRWADGLKRETMRASFARA